MNIMNLQHRLYALVFFCLLFIPVSLAQNAPVNLSPNGYFDKVFDRFGNEYRLNDIAISTVKSTPIPCGGNSYFRLWYDAGSGFEGNSAIEIARRNVLCQLFTDLSAFITPAIPQTTVNIWVRNIGDVMAAMQPPQIPAFSNVLGMATSFYTMPGNAPAVTGLVEGEIWKAIHNTMDSYTNVTPPLYTQGGASQGFFQGMIAFNFANITHTWNATMNQPAANEYDLYTLGLHEMTHALGIASLMKVNGLSKLSAAGYNYFSYYDKFLKAGNGLLLTNTGCSMYNYTLNPVYANNISSVLAPATSVGSPCTNTIVFAGSASPEQPVYTPNVFSDGSSLSHFEDQCHVPNAQPDNQYYVMSESGSTGPTYMKRYLKDEERKVLCDLGYNVGASYGNLAHFTKHIYPGAACSQRNVGGTNDGISNGLYDYEINVGQSIPIPGWAILGNDFNANQFQCLEDVYGNGIFNISSGGVNSTINYTGTAQGTALLRYVPTNTLTGQRGNITYIYVRVNSDNCYADPCNMIFNGEFEGAFPTCEFDISGNVLNCWQSYSSNPELFSRFCSAATWTVPSTKSIPSAETWNLGANNNNHFVGLYAYCGTNSGLIDSESMQTKLSTPLIPGNSYTLRFWARVADDPGQFANIPAHLAVCGSTNAGVLPTGSWFNMYDPLLSILVETITIPANGQWNEVVLNFVCPPSPQSFPRFIIGYYANSTLINQNRYVFLDAMELYPAPATPFFNPPAPLCVGDVLSNLVQYADPPGGTFSGNPGVILNDDGSYSFHASVPGDHQVNYTFVDGMGCKITSPVTIHVNPSGTPTLSLAYSSTVACYNTPVTLTVTGASSYTWEPAVICYGACNVATIMPGAPGIYTITGANGISCKSTITVEIASNSTLCCTQPANIIINNSNSAAYPMLDNQVVDIQGAFTVNTNVAYNNVTFRMAPNATISVNSVNSLTLNNCKLFSCTDMWDGIYLNQLGATAATLIAINGTSIEDAINGVFANSNLTPVASLIRFEGCVMNKNYKSFQIMNYLGISAYPLSIFQSTINCVSSFNSPGATLKAPYANNRSFIAIQLTKVKQVKVGNSTMGAYRNLINNSTFGIYSKESSLNVVNTTFSEMSGSFPICKFPPCDVYGIAIYVPNTSVTQNQVSVGGANLNEPNTFINVLRAIDVTYVEAFGATKNTFSCTSTSNNFNSGSGLLGQYGILATNIGEVLYISGNHLTNFATAIQYNRNNSVNNFNPGASILSNTVTSLWPGYVSQGIVASDLANNTITSGSTLRIRDNTLSNIVDYGIRVSRIRNKPVISGTGVLSQSIKLLDAPGSKFGIHIFDCPTALISNNKIESTSNANSSMHGIYLLASTNIKVQCNTMSLTCHGISISGDCTSSYTSTTNYAFGVVANTFDNTYTGLNFINSGRIGGQGAAAYNCSNKWVSPANSYLLGQTRTDASSSPLNSILFCKTSPTTYSPTNNLTNGGTAFGAASIFTAVGAVISCPAPYEIPGEDDDDDGRFGRTNETENTDIYEAIQHLMVYPNPNSGLFYVESEVALNDVSIRIHDLAGKLVLQKTMKTFTRETIDLGFADNGLYTLEIISGGTARHYKLIKQ
jgi:hypothetical protein